jgi:F-type H+-transporting ATPase subunit alpha
VNNGYFDDLEVAQVLPFEKGLKDHLRSKFAALVERIESKKELVKEDEAELVAAIQDFKKHGAF